MRAKLLVAGALFSIAIAIGLWPTGGGWARSAPKNVRTGRSMSLAEYDAAPPGRPLRLLFIHHSVGAELLADRGPDVRRGGLYHSHARGGGLRALLRENGYRVGEATYGSRIGEHTDLFDWLPKMRDHMDDVLRVDQQDRTLPAGEVNDIVLFKSCFPNGRFVGRGRGPGNPAGPMLTLANARATLNALLPFFAAHPRTLFVYLTTPPLAPRIGREPLLKSIARELLGRRWGTAELQRSGRLARELNTWLTAEDGWLAGYEGNNVVVFDYWDILTGEGRSNLLVYHEGGGYDAHPSLEGQTRAAPRLVDTLNRAVRRAGLVSSGAAELARASSRARVTSGE